MARKPDDKAIDISALVAAADAGDPQAQRDLGLRYKTGDGVDRDPEKSFHYMQLAADQGHADAQYQLAKAVERSQGIDAAIGLYRLAADQKHDLALCRLAECYLQGTGVPQDISEALKLYSTAAEEGSAPALRVLGISHELSKIAPTYPLTLQSFQRARDLNYSPALFNLIISLADTEGLPSDHAGIFFLAQKALCNPAIKEDESACILEAANRLPTNAPGKLEMDGDSFVLVRSFPDGSTARFRLENPGTAPSSAAIA